MVECVHSSAWCGRGCVQQEFFFMSLGGSALGRAPRHPPSHVPSLSLKIRGGGTSARQSPLGPVLGVHVTCCPWVLCGGVRAGTGRLSLSVTLVPETGLPGTAAGLMTAVPPQVCPRSRLNPSSWPHSVRKCRSVGSRLEQAREEPDREPGLGSNLLPRTPFLLGHISLLHISFQL